MEFNSAFEGLSHPTSLMCFFNTVKKNMTSTSCICVSKITNQFDTHIYIYINYLYIYVYIKIISE
jgi:hypothetical protein